MTRWSIRIALLAWFISLPLASGVHGQATPAAGQARAPRSGAELYRTACAACHATDGTGSPRSLVGFDLPLPDFTDCAFSTVEPDLDWLAVTHDGGPARGFDRRT